MNLTVGQIQEKQPIIATTIGSTKIFMVICYKNVFNLELKLSI